MKYFPKVIRRTFRLGIKFPFLYYFNFFSEINKDKNFRLLCIYLNKIIQFEIDPIENKQK